MDLGKDPGRMEVSIWISGERNSKWKRRQAGKVKNTQEFYLRSDREDNLCGAQGK